MEGGGLLKETRGRRTVGPLYVAYCAPLASTLMCDESDKLFLSALYILRSTHEDSEWVTVHTKAATVYT